MVNQPSLQSQLLKELVSYNDLSLAAKCAQDYSIPFSSLPSNLQIHIASSALSSTSIAGHDKTQSCQKSKLEADSSTRKLGKQRLPNSTRLVVFYIRCCSTRSCCVYCRECYHQLVLPDECIVHVNDLASFKRCRNAILKVIVSTYYASISAHMHRMFISIIVSACYCTCSVEVYVYSRSSLIRTSLIQILVYQNPQIWW